MSRTGIITWHNYPNFGSALQTYALQHFINLKGGDATVINYVPFFKPKLGELRYLLSKADPFIPHKISVKLNYRFIEFEKDFIPETESIVSSKGLKDLNNRFDNFVCGSDQIWAPNCFNENYFLSFVDDKKNKVSYAASIGLPYIPDYLKNQYRFLLSRFNHISLREQQGLTLIEELFGINGNLVLDPTLLIKKDDWLSIEKQYKGVDGKYILCYFLGVNEEHRQYAIKVSKKYNYKIICLSKHQNDYREEFNTISDAGPMEFINLINNAEVVLTDSFHGVCFSINLEKPFHCFERFKFDDKVNQNSRIYNILTLLDLNDRLKRDFQEIEEIMLYDINKVNLKLSHLRTVSEEFLKKSKIL